MRMFRSLWAAVLCCALLAGCSLPLQNQNTVEELLRAPRLSGDFGLIQSALNQWLGQSAQLKYPLSGELLSPFQMGDFDGDGVQDAAVLYTTAETPNVCLALLQKDAEGAWQVQGEVEGLADTVDSILFASLQEGGADQIVVAYTVSTATGENQFLAVYSYERGQLLSILEQACDQYLIEDITGNGYDDLVLMATGEDGIVRIELLTANPEGGFHQLAVMGLSEEKFVGYASLASGEGAYGGRYLVLDGWTGVSGTSLASVLLHFNEDTQQMEPASQITAEQLYNATLRSIPTLTSRDIDQDGVVEIPVQIQDDGVLNLSQNRRMSFIRWMDYTRFRPEKSFGLVDEEMGCYLALPQQWEGDLMLVDSETEPDAVELRSLDGEKLYLTIRITGTSAASGGWTRLGVVASRQIQARYGPDAPPAGNYRLSKSLYLL